MKSSFITGANVSTSINVKVLFYLLCLLSQYSFRDKVRSKETEDIKG